jgi:hypothetical protein
MRRGRWFASVAVVVLGAAGLAVATPAPVPEADPIGDVIANSPPTQSDPGVIAPASPLSPTEGLLTETPAIEVTEERAEEEGTTEMPLGTPLPELADPLPRSRQGFAIVQALDKVTAETIRFAVPVGQQRRWRGLIFSARACETTAPDEPMRDSMAYLEIFSQPRGHDGVGEPREIFQGWMFASSPGLNPVEHPLYDAWVIACQAEAPSAA